MPPPPAVSSAHAVFLSYASEDAAAAARLCGALRAAGIEVWFDQSELRGGDAWDAAIRQQIKSCALFMPLISAHSRVRAEGYFRLEWKLAVDRSHLMAADKAFLVPVVIDATTDMDARVPEKFRDVQWMRLPGGEPPPACVDRIKQLLSGVADDRVPAADTDSAAKPRPRARRRAVWISAGLAAAIAAAFALVHFAGSSRTGQSAAVAANAGLDKSIAVMPFVDLSEKKDQEYFSDGLAEELIGLLAKLPDLRVTARTSSFAFRGRAVTAGEIGATLKVANLLEGSVRKAGDTVRISVQLVRADNGFELWSETYDRNLSDVFKIQEDIAREVVGKLKLTLLPAATHVATETTNPEVHDLYLQGQALAAEDTAAGLTQAIERYRRALVLDPRYAPAWSKLSFALYRQFANGYAPPGPGLERTAEAIDHALQLDPTQGEPYAMLGLYKMSSDHDWAGAKVALETAVRLDPTDASSLFLMGHLTRAIGDTDGAMVWFQRALERDPLNLLIRRYIGRAQLFAGRYAEAEATMRQIIARNPTFNGVHYELGRILLSRGRAGEALAEFEAESSSGWREFGLPLGLHAVARQAEAQKAFEQMLRNPTGSEYQVAETYATFGDVDRAFQWLDKAVKQDPGIQWLRGDPAFKSMTGDPRYAALFKRLNLAL